MFRADCKEASFPIKDVRGSGVIVPSQSKRFAATPCSKPGVISSPRAIRVLNHDCTIAGMLCKPRCSSAYRQRFASDSSMLIAPWTRLDMAKHRCQSLCGLQNQPSDFDCFGGVPRPSDRNRKQPDARTRCRARAICPTIHPSFSARLRPGSATLTITMT